MGCLSPVGYGVKLNTISHRRQTYHINLVDLTHIIFARLTLNCFRRACYFQSVILSIIICILHTQKDVSSLSRKGLLT